MGVGELGVHVIILQRKPKNRYVKLIYTSSHVVRLHRACFTVSLVVLNCFPSSIKMLWHIKNSTKN